MGTVGIISAFNFPVAVWAWNTASQFVVMFAFGNHPKKHHCGIAVRTLLLEVIKEITFRRNLFD
jgi:aldehyde dehydrogenase (NAD+)